MDRSSRQKIHKDIAELYTTNQLDIMKICRLLYPTFKKYTICSSSHETFTKTDYTLGHKRHLNKFKRIETIQCLLLDHYGIKLEINNRDHWQSLKYVHIKQQISKQHMGPRRNLKKNEIVFLNKWMKTKVIKISGM